MSRSKIFLLLLLCSLLLATAPIFFAFKEIEQGVFLSFVPLLIYSFWLFRQESLLQQDIDSVYYFGFILTLATLGVAARTLATSSEPDNALSVVGRHFAIGLLATGYGLVGRIVLQEKRVSIDTVDEALDKQLDQVSRIVREFGSTIDLFKDLKEEAVRGAIKGASGASAEVVRLISSDLEGPIVGLRNAIGDLKESLVLVDRSNFDNLASSSSALKDRMIALDESAMALSLRLRELNNQTPILKSEFQATGEELAAVTEAQKQLRVQIAGLVDSTQSFLAVLASQRQAAVDSGDSMKSLSVASKAASVAIGTFERLDMTPLRDLSKHLQTLANSLPKALGGLELMSEKFNAAGKSQNDLTEAAIAAGQSLSDIPTGVSSVQLSLASLNPKFSELGLVISSASSALNSLSKLDLSSVPMLSDRFSEMAKRVADFSKSLDTAQAALPRSLEGIERELGELSSYLKTEAADLKQASELLGGAMQTIARSLKDSISTIGK